MDQKEGCKDVSMLMVKTSVHNIYALSCMLKAELLTTGRDFDLPTFYIVYVYETAFISL